MTLPHASLLALVADLADPHGRAEASVALARHLGVECLLIFIPDPELGTLLPAPGFPQTLPGGHRWRAFLAACIDAGHHSAELPFPAADSMCRAVGIARGGSVLVLLGGTPADAEAAEVATLLPVLTAAFRGEQQARIAESHAAVAERTAAEARALATTLDATRRDLQRALDETAAALRLRDEFLASVSHDLKTPLTTIKGLTQLLLRQATRADARPASALVEGLRAIDRMSTRMAGMVGELVDLARSQAGKPLDLERRPTDLVALVHQLVDDYRRMAEQHCFLVRASVAEMVGRWDPLRIERALSNLLGNAVKYSPAGSEITVTVDRAHDGGREWAVVAVTDQGPGIPAADLPHIFGLFYRGAGVRGRIDGTGIGLAGARQIVEQHGGTIDVDSAEGRGSIFTVRLPLD